MVRCYRRSLPLVLCATLLAAGFLALAGSPRAVRAADCDAVSDGFMTITEPVGWNSPVIQGPAPLKVTISVVQGALVYDNSTLSSHYDWGDGTTSDIQGVPCDDGTGEMWPEQSHSHTYSTPGTYNVSWKFTLLGQSYNAHFVQVVVEAPAATPPPATQAPATAVPATTTAVPGTATATSAATGTSTATPDPGSPTASPTPSPSPSPSPSATAVRSATAVVPGVTTPEPPSNEPPRGEDPAPRAGEPEILQSVPSPSEVSTDPGVLITNLAIAGVTVWVLFSSVFLNQVMQDNRSEVERRTRWLTRPLARAAGGVGGDSSSLRRWAGPAAVLLFTGGIYSVLEPSFGLNRATLVLFLAAVLGVGVITYVCSGLEVLATRRITGATAAVRAYPAMIAIAVVSVAISRVLDLTPGIMYGFIASCVVLTPINPTERETGRIAFIPVSAGIALTIAAWLALWPLEDAGSSLPADVARATALVVFIGGIEGLFISMAPLAVTDGGKLFRWRKGVWAAIALLASFLAWHILFSRDREYFSGLREAQSVTLIALFVVYSALSLGAWLWFRHMNREETEPTAAHSPEPASGA